MTLIKGDWFEEQEEDFSEYAEDTTITLRDWQRRGKEFFLKHNGKAIFEVVTGGGKCFKKGTEMLMFDGSIKKVEDIIIGDKLMGDDSMSRIVTSLASGEEMMYDVIPVKGDKYTVNESHILSLKYTNLKKYYKLKDGTKKQYLDKRSFKKIDINIKKYINTTKYEKHVLKGYRVPVEFKKQKINIDPYYLGLWLGDGNKNNTMITNSDKEIINFLQNYSKKLNLNFSVYINKRNNNCNGYKINKGYDRSRDNSLLESLRDYNLLNNKYIPKQFLINSRKNRLQLLAGLLDTDGYLDNNGFEIVQKSNRLTEDILFLVRSLGFAAYSSKKIGKIKSINFEGEYNRISISGDCSIIPNKVKRKQAEKRKQKKDVLVTGIKVKPVGVGEYYGFTLKGNNNRFLLKDFTVVHNTFFIIDIIQELLEKEPDLKILIVVPKNIILETGWYKELVDAGISIPKIGVYYGDIKEYSQITLTNMQNIHKIPVELFDCHVFDECFMGDTKVWVMNNNRTQPNKNGQIVETTIKGLVNQKSTSRVVSFNIKTKEFELKKIINWYRIPHKKKLIKLFFDNNSSITVTPKQEFYNGDKYIYAKDIKKNDSVVYYGNESSIIKCVDKQIIDHDDYVYDIEVEDNHNFFANNMLVHNCHNFATKRMLKYLNTPSKYKIGLTATLKRLDDKHFKIMKIFDYNIFKYGAEEALIDGILNPFIFVNISTKLDSKERIEYDILTQQLNTIFLSGGSFQHIMRANSPLKFKMLGLINKRKEIVNNYHEKFNIATQIILHHKDNKIIVFNQFNKQTSKLYWYLLEYGIKCRVVHSEISKEKREQAIMDFKNNKYNVLLTTKVLDEGMNIPKLDVAIIMAGDSTDKQTIQRMGRVLRKKKGQDSMLYQIYCENTIEEKNALERAKIFKKLSSDYKDINYVNGQKIVF